MDGSLCIRCFILIDDRKEIKESKKKHGLPQFDYDKYMGRVGRVYSTNGYGIGQLQDHDENLTVNHSLITEATSKTLPPSTDALFTSTESNAIKSTPNQGPNETSRFYKSIEDDTITDIETSCKDNKHINDCNQNQQNALHIASYQGNVTKMKTLIKNLVNPLSVDNDGDSILHLAIFGKHRSAVKFLMKNYPQLIKIKNLKSQTPLLLAAKLNHGEIFLELLEEYDCQMMNEQDKSGNVVLHYITRYDNCRLLKRLLKYEEIKLDLLNSDGYSPYHIACLYGNRIIIHVLQNYARKYNLSFMDQLSLNNETGVHLAMQDINKNFDLISHLIKSQPREWSKDPIHPKYGTILHYAVRLSNFEIVNDIINIDLGIVNIKDNKGMSPLDLALKRFKMRSPINYIQRIDICRVLFLKGTVSVLPKYQEALNTISLWIKYFQSENLQKSNMDANFLSLIYEALLSMNERSAHLSPMNIFNLSNEIIRMFTIHFKSEIINKLKNNSRIQETEKLALNCVYVSVNILGYWAQTDRSLVENLDDEYIRDIFHSFFNLICDSAIALRICESILYALCNICSPGKMVIKRDIWIPKLKECFIEKSSSQEIKLASSIMLSRMTIEIEEIYFDILYYLLQIATDLTDKRMGYMGFPFPEIIYTVAHMIQVLSRYIQSFSITRDDKRENHWANVNQVLCNIYHKPPIKHDLYRLNLTNLLVCIMESFSRKLKQSILHKLTHQIIFSDMEKIYLNCFCNAVNVLGQHVHDWVENYSIRNWCDLIFIYLTDLEQSVEHSGIALRVAEILLYCLCNILMSKSICNGEIWKDILWRYFIKEKSSNEIKMASGIAMAHVWKIGGSYSGGDHSKLRDYLMEIHGNFVISTPEYFGFSSDTIEQSLSKMDFCSKLESDVDTILS